MNVRVSVGLLFNHHFWYIRLYCAIAVDYVTNYYDIYMLDAMLNSIIWLCCAFSFAGPHTWNSLPDQLRTSVSLATFKRSLKTFFIWADYAFSALETILSCLMGYISVLSNSNSNSRSSHSQKVSLSRFSHCFQHYWRQRLNYYSHSHCLYLYSPLLKVTLPCHFSVSAANVA